MKILVIDDEPETRLNTISEWFKVIFPKEIIKVTHSYFLPKVIEGFDAVSFDNDLGEFGDVVKELKDCNIITDNKVSTIFVIHSMNPVANHSIYNKLKDISHYVHKIPFSEMLKRIKQNE